VTPFRKLTGSFFFFSLVLYSLHVLCEIKRITSLHKIQTTIIPTQTFVLYNSFGHSYNVLLFIKHYLKLNRQEDQG
jgi:hypothetical protein